MRHGRGHGLGQGLDSRGKAKSTRTTTRVLIRGMDSSSCLVLTSCPAACQKPREHTRPGHVCKPRHPPMISVWISAVPPNPRSIPDASKVRLAQASSTG